MRRQLALFFCDFRVQRNLFNFSFARVPDDLLLAHELGHVSTAAP